MVGVQEFECFGFPELLAHLNADIRAPVFPACGRAFAVGSRPAAWFDDTLATLSSQRVLL